MDAVEDRFPKLKGKIRLCDIGTIIGSRHDGHDLELLVVQGLGHRQALVDVHIADPVALGADDAVGLALRQQLHRLVAHAGGGDAVLGGGAAAPLDVAKDRDAGIQPQLLFDLLTHGHAAGGALSHHDHKVGLAADAGAADLLSHVLSKS